MTRPGRTKSLVFIFLFFASVASQANFTQCLETFRASGDATGGTDWFGRPVNNSRDAVALTYETCTSLCGSGQAAFDWSVFSQQFSAWLLPWLALVSQLPFGAESLLDNLISGELPRGVHVLIHRTDLLRYAPVALTVGSPTLAAFSLALTAINARWANDRFSGIGYPNHKNAARALIHLQQVPLHLTTRDGLLASLIVLPENEVWWKCLVTSLEKTHTWTIAAAASIVWVIVSFVFTIVDSFKSPGTNVDESGQGVGTLWLWLVPIVIGWLWIPVFPRDKLEAAINNANSIAYVAAPDNPPQIDDPPTIGGPRHLSRVPLGHAITIYHKREVFTQDAARVPPVFNYARFWEWSSDVETIARAFEKADEKAARQLPVNPTAQWVHAQTGIHDDNRTGNVSQVQAYCEFPIQGNEEPPQPIPSGMWKRIFVASAFALGLQWATTGSASLIVIFTPTTGLGCRSATYILYGLVSTTIWVMLLSSSYLAHYAKVRHGRRNDPRSGLNSAGFAEGLAAFLRRLATFLAVCNTFCGILAGAFQFSNFFSTCYCNSSVLGWGAQHAYNVIDFGGYDYQGVTAAWAGGVVLAGVYVILFLFSLHVILEPWNNTVNR